MHRVLWISVGVVLLATVADAEVLAWWRFDDARAGSAEDRVLRSEKNGPVMAARAHKAPEGSLEFTDDKPGRFIYDPEIERTRLNESSLRFRSYKDDEGNWRSDHIRVDRAIAKRPKSFTIEGFVKDDPETGGEHRGVIIRFGEPKTGYKLVWGLDVEEFHPGAIKKVRMKFKGKELLQYRGKDSPAITQKGWHHFALTYDHTTGRLKLYWDHQLAVEQQPGPAKPDYKPEYKIYIGGVPDGHGFNGWMDEIRWSDQALSPDEMLNAHERPKY